MSSRSEKTASRVVNPGTLATRTDKMVNDFEALRNAFQNAVLSGAIVTTPTTGSTQASSTGNTVWNVNIVAGLIVVDGVVAEVAAAADYTIHTGSLYTGGLSSGQSAVATLVAKNVSGTVTLEVVKGAAATTGSQVAPTDAAIQAAVGAGNAWIRLADCTINRTGDTTVTQAQNNAVRPILGISEDVSFGDWSSIADA